MNRLKLTRLGNLVHVHISLPTGDGVAVSTEAVIVVRTIAIILATAVITLQQVLVGDICLHIPLTTGDGVAVATEAVVVVGAVATMAATTVNADAFPAQAALAINAGVADAVIAHKQVIVRDNCVFI